MIPAPFEYRRARTLDDALEALSDDGDTKVLAGGHSLIPLMKLRLAQPDRVVDIAGIPGLDFITRDGSRVRIGALATHHAVATSAITSAHVPLVALTAASVGDPQVRHRGTLGGTVSHGDPSGDLPTALVALDATIAVVSPRGRRDVPAHDFFRGFLETDLEPDEIVVEVSIPEQATPGRSTYLKFRRRALDWAVVGVAVSAWRDNDQPRARVALASMGPTPVRARAVEAALESGAGGNLADVIAAAAELAVEGTAPRSDLNGSTDYRRHLATVLTRRALADAFTPQE
jgi:aerobic carbon-monoxide dehydrogenase medium subunit